MYYWCVTPCRLVQYFCFRRIWYFHLQTILNIFTSHRARSFTESQMHPKFQVTICSKSPLALFFVSSLSNIYPMTFFIHDTHNCTFSIYSTILYRCYMYRYKPISVHMNSVLVSVTYVSVTYVSVTYVNVTYERFNSIKTHRTSNAKISVPVQSILGFAIKAEFVSITTVLKVSVICPDQGIKYLLVLYLYLYMLICSGILSKLVANKCGMPDHFVRRR